jgi:tRNA nucleotidyltransferase (CCA-adding enzyme)
VTTAPFALPADVDRVLDAIRAAGGRPMLDGGFVRDSLMGISGSKDIDMEVYGISDPDVLLAALRGLGHATGGGKPGVTETPVDGGQPVRHVMEAGKVYGVIKVRVGELDIDVSIPRRETKTGAGHRGFTVIPDGDMGFAEATARRDFTVNAILYDPASGEVTDCHGGLADLEAGILRHTSERFSEDPLRVLRGVQFAARFGFRMAPETIALCAGLIPRYKEISRERVWTEWHKLAAKGRHVSLALITLEYTGWEALYPALAGLHGVPQDPERHPEGDVWVHSGLAADQAARLADEAGLAGTDRAVIVLAALLHDLGKVTHTQVKDGRIVSHGHAEAGEEPARAFLNSIGCPEDIRRRVVRLVREHMSVIGEPSKAAVRRLVRRLQPATLTELHLVAGADCKGRGDPDAPNHADPWLAMGADMEMREKPRAAILTGDHLIAAGMRPGPAFGPLLAGALAAQDEGEFDDEAGAVRWLAARKLEENR